MCCSFFGNQQHTFGIICGFYNDCYNSTEVRAANKIPVSAPLSSLSPKHSACRPLFFWHRQKASDPKLFTLQALSVSSSSSRRRGGEASACGGSVLNLPQCVDSLGGGGEGLVGRWVPAAVTGTAGRSGRSSPLTSPCRPPESGWQSVRWRWGPGWSHFLPETRRWRTACRGALGGGGPQTPGYWPGSPHPPGKTRPV